jgi:hypothetical protein
LKGPAAALAAAVAPALLVVALGATPVAAQAVEPVEPDPPPGEGLSTAVARVPLTSPELTRAEDALSSMRTRQREASRRLEEVGPELASLRQEVEALDGVVRRRDAQIDKGDDALARARTAVRHIAVEWYVTGFGALEGLDPALTSDDRERLSHQYVLSQSAAGAALDDQRQLEARLAELRADRDAVGERRAERGGRADELEAERVELTAALEEAARRLPQLEADVRTAQLGARVVGSDLSAVALDAYWRAELTLALLDPDCGVTWSLLAGIGRIESGHGTYRGNEVAADGKVTPGIYGPLLDGSAGPFAILRDSDGGALDGVASTDRAVGPMQFIPSTWRMVATDGTGDGTADPQNLFDAAVTAGVYLCRSGPGLGSVDRLRAAVFSYNHSTEYVDAVLAGADRYRTDVALSR